MEHTQTCQAHTENHFGKKVTATEIDIKEDMKGTLKRRQAESRLFSLSQQNFDFLIHILSDILGRNDCEADVRSEKTLEALVLILAFRVLFLNALNVYSDICVFSFLDASSYTDETC